MYDGAPLTNEEYDQWKSFPTIFVLQVNIQKPTFLSSYMGRGSLEFPSLRK